MGFASGFHAGAQAAERGIKLREEEELKRGLAAEAAKYTPTEGAYGQGLQSNIEQVQGLKQQAIEGGMTPEMAAQQYDPSIQELTRRQGLTAPDFSVASGPTNYATRQEALQAAAPMRTEGLANVYRQAGQIDKAEELVARAQQQRMTGLQIGEAERTRAERDAATAREKASADAWKARLAVKDEEGNVTGMRPPTNEDMLWAAQQSAQSLYGAGKTTEAMQAYSNYMTTAKGQIELQGAQRAEALRGTVSRVASGDLDAAKDFYHKFVPDGTNVRSFSADKDGKIVVKREDLHGNALPDAVLTKDQLLQQLVAFENPAKLIDYTQQSFMNGLHERQLEEQKRHNKATEGNQAAQIGLSKAANMVDVVTADNKLTQIDRSKYIDKNGQLQLPEGWRLHKEDTSDKTLRINDKGVAMQGSKIVGKFDEATNSVVPSTPNPLTTDPKANQKFIEGGVKAAPVQTSRGGAYTWGYTVDGQTYYSTPQEALADAQARAPKPASGLQSNIPAPTGPLPTLQIKPGMLGTNRPFM